MLTDSGRNAEEITRPAKAKVIYSVYAFAASKVREIASCGFCNVPQCIYSKKAVGEPNGLIKIQSCVLNKCTDSGYACGNEVTVEVFYAHQKLSCGNTVDIHSYNLSVGTKGGRIGTKRVSSV